METKRIAILLMIFCTLFTSLGQILWKLGLNNINFKIPITFLNVHFILGFVSYAASAIFMLLAFKRGELSVLYPIAATSYVWVSLFSPFIFATDSMNLIKWVGIGIIMVSVSMLGYGCSKNGCKVGSA